MSDVILSLATVPALEEALVDWLLSLDAGPRFTTISIDGHGMDLEGLTIAEQVTGRKRMRLFQVEASLEQAGVIVARLRRDFAGAQIRFWMTPVLEAGSLDDAAQ